MTDRHLNRDARDGRFVSADYAEANPDTTVAQTITEPTPDRLGEIRAEIVRLTDSEPSLALHAVPGIELTGTEPLDLYERALIAVRAALGEGEGDA